MRSKSATRQVGKRRRGAHQLEEIVLAPFGGRTFGDDLLRKDVHGKSRRMHRIERAAAHAREQGRALDQLITRHRIQAALGHAATAVARSPDPLQECRDAARRSDLADHLDRPDVDTELERCRGHQSTQLTGAQLRFDPLPPLLGEAAVVRGNRFIAEALREQVRDPLGHASRVDEDERGAMRIHMGRDGIEHLAELLA